MRNPTVISTFFLVASLLTAPARAAEGEQSNPCQIVQGTGLWTLIPSPADALGRVLGPTSGDLKSSVSAYLTSLTPQPTGEFIANSVEVWSVERADRRNSDRRTDGATPRDLIIFSGKATFTPITGEPVGTVKDQLTLTVTGGTGAYAGATGSLDVIGTGYHLFGPNAAPGNTFFRISYNGRICKAVR